MINRIRENLRRKLNKRGVSLAEIFFSFLVVIMISVIMLNAFSKRDTLTQDVEESERDYFESLKAISRGLLFHGVESNYNIHLTGYVPVVNVDKPNEFHLVNVYDPRPTGDDVVAFGQKYEVFNRIVLGETILKTRKDSLIEDYRASVTLKTYSNGKFTVTQTPSLLTQDRGNLTGNGVYYTIPTSIFKPRYSDYNFDNLILPANISIHEVKNNEELY